MTKKTFKMTQIPVTKLELMKNVNAVRRSEKIHQELTNMRYKFVKTKLKDENR